MPCDVPAATRGGLPDARQVGCSRRASRSSFADVSRRVDSTPNGTIAIAGRAAHSSASRRSQRPRARRGTTASGRTVPCQLSSLRPAPPSGRGGRRRVAVERVWPRRVARCSLESPHHADRCVTSDAAATTPSAAVPVRSMKPRSELPCGISSSGARGRCRTSSTAGGPVTDASTRCARLAATRQNSAANSGAPSWSLLVHRLDAPRTGQPEVFFNAGPGEHAVLIVSQSRRRQPGRCAVPSSCSATAAVVGMVMNARGRTGSTCRSAAPVGR